MNADFQNIHLMIAAVVCESEQLETRKKNKEKALLYAPNISKQRRRYNSLTIQLWIIGFSVKQFPLSNYSLVDQMLAPLFVHSFSFALPFSLFP